MVRIHHCSEVGNDLEEDLPLMTLQLPPVHLRDVYISMVTQLSLLLGDPVESQSLFLWMQGISQPVMSTVFISKAQGLQEVQLCRSIRTPSSFSHPGFLSQVKVLFIFHVLKLILILIREVDLLVRQGIRGVIAERVAEAGALVCQGPGRVVTQEVLIIHMWVME
jgi:hypothetical protein